MRRKGRDFIARHGETVFNAGGVLQGPHVHTPLTRRGFAQADAMGAALQAELGPRPPLTLWSSPAGRALQTLSVICEHLELDWHAARIDDRLVEIAVGSWAGRRYAELMAEGIVAIDTATGALHPAPDGEDYPAIRARVAAWAEDTAGDPGDRLVVTHGIAGRVLRGVLLGRPPAARFGVPLADGLPQGSMAVIAEGAERIVCHGDGRARA